MKLLSLRKRLSLPFRRYLKPLFLFTGLLLCLKHGFATDILSSGVQDVQDTVKGSGMKYLILAEIVVSVLVFVSTRNIKALLGVFVISVFINVAYKVMGL